MPGATDRALLDLAARLAVESGRMVRAARASRGHVSSTSKSAATDMVTEFDRASERHIVEGILAARPADAIVGEEGTSIDGGSGVEWVIDPIDGTTNFVYGLPGYAVSIAARVDGRTRAAAVHLPATDEVFTATLGGGARCDGRAIACSDTSELAMALVATGFGYDVRRRAAQAARAALLLPRVRDIRRLGAAAADLCHLAAGRVDAYFEQWLGPWDFAAGELIAREAGCRAAGAAGGAVGSGAPGEGSWVVAAPPALFEALTALLSETMAAVPDDATTS